MGGYGAGMVPNIIGVDHGTDERAAYYTPEHWARIAEGDRLRQERAAGRAWLSRCTVLRQLRCGVSDFGLAAGWLI